MTRTKRTLLAATLTIVTTTAIGYGWPTAGQVLASASDEAPPQQSAIEEAPQHQPAIQIVGGTTDQQELAQWAVERYQEAGLPLPAVRIEFHATREGCRGYLGHYSKSQLRVDVCNSDNERTAPIHTLLHELAHAWSFELPESTIDAFTEHRGLSAWHDADVAWWKQAKEQAAEIVAWGLMDGDDPFLNRWVIGEPCDELIDAFVLLTGRTPLHESEESCRSSQ